MFRIPHVLIALLFAATISIPVSGDVLLSTSLTGETNVNTGEAGANKTFSVFIGEDAASNDSAFLTVASFQLEAGAVVSGVVSDPGVPGTPGYFAAGNLSTSTFTVNSSSVFTINQEVTAATGQPLLNSPLRDRWFDVEIDTTGLADGVYGITLTAPGNTFRDPAFDLIATNNDLTFTVGAVPEPGSVGFLMIAGTVALLRRRRG